MIPKLNKPDPIKFWCHVQKQFESTDFSNVLSVHDAIQYNPLFYESLIPFLTKQIYITDDLDIKIRFELLSPTSQFNFISLIALSSNIITTVPDSLLSDAFLKSIYESYTERPPEFLHDIQTELPIPEIIEEEESDPPDIQSDIGTPEFYEELDSILASYPHHAEQIVNEYFHVDKFQDFHNLLTGFYSQNRSLEGSTFVIRYCIRPYVAALKSTANRIVSDTLLILSHSVPELIIDELIQPIVFDPDSTVYQFELFRRLFREELICQNLLLRLFQSRPPSLEAKLSKEALDLIKTAIQKTPQLPDQMQKHVLLHIRNQIEQNENASQLLIFYFKNQIIRDPEIKSIAMDTLSLIPDRLASLALQDLNRE